MTILLLAVMTNKTYFIVVSLLYSALMIVSVVDASVPLSLDNTKVLNVVGDPNVNSGWIDSYSVGGHCYCASTFDHDIGTIIVSTPLGRKTVKEVCDIININAPSKTNRPVYNDIQCGNGPDNGLNDEKICPGRTDHGQTGCKYIGPKWNFSSLIPTTPTRPSIPAPKPVSIPASVPVTKPVTKPIPKPVVAPTPAPTIICFSFHNTVEVKGIGHIRINQLKIGDFVRVTNDGFSQVYGFGHLDHDIQGDFLRIEFDATSINDKEEDMMILEISPRHLLFIDSNSTKVIPASDVKVGDLISGKEVISIDRVNRRGVCAPLTRSGDIIVSGIRASNYVVMIDNNLVWNQHVLGHMYMFPHRLYCKYFLEICKKESYTNGYSYWIHILVRIGTIINKDDHIISSVVWCLTIPLIMISSVMDSLTGFILLCLCAGVITWQVNTMIIRRTSRANHH